MPKFLTKRNVPKAPANSAGQVGNISPNSKADGPAKPSSPPTMSSRSQP